MDAVGKIGSYISRGVYTVSGPFHPFGGAVDIIVVQQQDGSFKSSPWYVRFGKFQGVLKTKEQLVTISVNGIETGFNMYLDHKGEAFFLRDLEAGEGEFVLSPPTSGDETEGMTKNGRFMKSQSFDVEGGQRELVTAVDNRNGKIVTRTNSRRSTIFGLVFGRKSIKVNDKGGKVERVSSFERAEIAADLLEMKWSTNLASSNLRADIIQEKPSENSGVNFSVADEEQGPHTTLPNDGLHCDENLISHGERMNDNFGTGILNKNCLEEARDNNPSCLRVSEETTEMYTSSTGDKMNSDQKMNPVVDPQICQLDIDGTFGDSFASYVEGLRDTRTNDMLTEKNFEEITSHEEAVQIYTMEIGDSADRNELISELVPVHSNETNVQNPGSTAQFHAESRVGSTAGIPPFESGEKEITCISHCKSVESSKVRFNISDDKSSEHLSLLSGGTEHCNNRFLCNASNTITEVSSLSESGVSLGKEISDGCHDQNLETSGGGESHVSEKSQYGSPRNGTLEGSDINGLNTESDPNSSSEQISNGLPLLSNQELLSREHEAISMHVMVKESSHDRETNFQQIDFLRSCSRMGEREATQIPSFLVSLSSNPVNSGAIAESHSMSEIPNSCNSSNVAQKENFDVGDNLKRFCSFEGVNVAQDFGIISKPTEVAEYNVPCSDSSEDIQFPFSDIDHSCAKEIDTVLSNNDKVAGAEELPTLSAECDVEEQDLPIEKHEKSLDGISNVLMSQSSPVSIPGCKTSFGEIELSSRSLPIIRSHIMDLEGHIEDLEGYDLHHSLSCSLNSKTDICELDVHKNEDSSFSKLEAEPQREVIQRYTSSAADTDISAENEEQKVTLTNATIESSLCKHLLFEGMGSDAARQVFDVEKENFFEPQGIIPVDGAEKKGGASRSITPCRGSWNLWPFLKKSQTISNDQATSEGTKEMDVDPASKSTRNMTLESDMQRAKNSKKEQSLTPTSEELASLNLREGPNVVTFSFSTPMLGLQQVDARIYLWKWNTRIVISDVDGTITKSDVLGQFMPLVGIDWSQTGVTHLFSAIKDNGYQLLFLSARAISQAHLTRQFLFNLKQDGKALPDGPVFISPDGLFPSLYREVIRRAPHEFKISCLEAIKALFPPDCNPFYAGFGNRDTDEISYLKVGIPLGKIFIINPKGQVAVNRQVDTRSYASLHELVNGIFPPISSFEQEDYNSWNYWKLPLAEVDI